VGGWYYQSEGDHAGPVDEERIKVLVASGALNTQSLIWSSSFGNSWKPLGETAFAPTPSNDGADVPPPLPMPTAQPEASASGQGLNDTAKAQPGGPEEFLKSDLARQLIDKNAEHYLVKWRALLEANSYDPRAAAKQRSWNWPAFFIPYGWLIYRKIYGLGALMAAGVLLSQFFGRVGMVLPIAASVTAALYGDAWYFDALYKKWLRLRTIGDADLTRRAATADGGTNLPLALGTGAVLLVAAAIITSGSDFFSSDLSCSSGSTRELVAKIAREQIPKDNYMMFVVDEKATKISLDAIRTQGRSGASLNCAASILYSLAFKDPGGEAVRVALEQVLNRQITYKVENTDRGDQIYVTVFGLNN
jgi:hypothetical protein